MDSSLIKINVYRSKEIIKGALNLFLGFQGFISEKPLKGPEEVEIGWGKVRGIGRIGSDPEAKGFEGFLGHLCCVGCHVVVKEAWPKSRRRPSGKLEQLWHNGTIDTVMKWSISLKASSGVIEMSPSSMLGRLI